MSEKQARQQARNAPSDADTPEQRRQIAPQVPNMLPMNIAGSFGGSTARSQSFPTNTARPPAAPRSIHRPGHPTFVGSGYLSSISWNPTDRLHVDMTSGDMDASLGGRSNHTGFSTNTPRPVSQFRAMYRTSDAPPQTSYLPPQLSNALAFSLLRPSTSPNPFTTVPGRNQTGRIENEKAGISPYGLYTPMPGPSRVPPNSVGRKAPLMKDSPMQNLSPTELRKSAMVEQTRSTREPTPRQAPAQPDATTPTPKPNANRQRSLKRSQPPKTGNRSKVARRGSTNKDPINENDLDADGSTDDEYIPTKPTKKATSASSTSIMSSNQNQAPPEASTTMPPTAQPAPTSSTPTVPAPRPAPLRPRYTYVVPPTLLGTQTALGPNWDEYIRLIEDIVLNETTDAEFESRGKRLFDADPQTRHKLHKLVTRDMIVPKLIEEQRRLERAEAKKRVQELAQDLEGLD